MKTVKYLFIGAGIMIAVLAWLFVGNKQTPDDDPDEQNGEKNGAHSNSAIDPKSATDPTAG